MLASPGKARAPAECPRELVKAAERVPGTRRALRLAGYVASAGLLAWLVFLVGKGWHQVARHHWSLNVSLLVFSWLLLLAARVLLPFAVYYALRAFSRRVPLGTCWWVYSLSQFAKYAPGGGVWLVLARAYLYRRLRIAGATGILLMVTEQGLLVGGACLVLAFSLGWFPGLGWGLWVVAVGGCPLVLCLLFHPRFLSWLHRLLASRFEQEATGLEVGALPLLCSGAIFALFWLVSGVAFWMLTSALLGVKQEGLAVCVGAFAGACALGFLFFLMPAGLGAREGGLAGMLSLLYPLPLAAALALTARFWWFLADLAFCSGSLLALRLLGLAPSSLGIAQPAAQPRAADAP